MCSRLFRATPRQKDLAGRQLENKPTQLSGRHSRSQPTGPSRRYETIATPITIINQAPTGLRHTWATIALNNNVHLKVVSDRLNHSITDITARVYSHVTRPIAQEAADLVGGLILGRTNVR